MADIASGLECMSPILNLTDGDDGQLLDLGTDLEEIFQEFEPLFHDVAESHNIEECKSMDLHHDGSDSDSGISVISDPRDSSPVKQDTSLPLIVSCHSSPEPITTEVVYENEVPLNTPPPVSTSHFNFTSQSSWRFQPSSIVVSSIGQTTRLPILDTKPIQSQIRRTWTAPQHKVVQVKMESGDLCVHQSRATSQQSLMVKSGIQTGKMTTVRLQDAPTESFKASNIVQNQIKIQPKPEFQYETNYEPIFVGSDYSPLGSDNSDMLCDSGISFLDLTHDDSLREVTTPSNSLWHSSDHGLSLDTSNFHLLSSGTPSSVSGGGKMQGTRRVSMPPTTQGNPLNLDRIIKKQERMIKNRQAASLSRQRKKEYLERLESRMEQLKKENTQLRHQNLEWRERYLELETKLREYERQHGVSSPSSNITFSGMKSRATLTATAATTMFAVIMFLAVNFNSSVSILPSNNINGLPASMASQGRLAGWQDDKIGFLGSPSIDHPRGHLSRTLMSIDSSTTDRSNATTNGSVSRPPTNENATISSHQRCAELNHTESIRLAEELNDWVSRYKEEARQAYLKGMRDQRLKDHQNRNKGAKAHSPRVPSLNSGALAPTSEELHYPSPVRNSHRHSRHWSQESHSQNLLRIYDSSFYPNMDQLFNTLNWQNDTMYVVSLRSDHLVFPATVHNKTQPRAKIAFVFPAPYGLNDTDKPRSDQMALMQIECQVVNFTILHMDKAQMPSRHAHQHRHNYWQTSPEDNL